MSLRQCVAAGVLLSLAAGVLCGLAYHAATMLADSFTSSAPGVPLP